MKALLGIFANWQVKIAIVLLVLGSLFAWHKYEVKVAVNEAVTTLNDQYSKETFRLKDKANTDSINLRNTVETIRKEKKNELEIANRRYSDLLSSVSNRPDRPSSSSISGSTSNGTAQEGATGLQLSRSDGEFLIRFARDTSELQTELKSCLKQYNEVKIKLDQFRIENTPKTK